MERLPFVIQVSPGVTLTVKGLPAAEGAEARVRLSIQGAEAADLTHVQASDLRTALQVQILGAGGGYLT